MWRNAGQYAEYNPQLTALSAADGWFARGYSTGYIGRLCRCLLYPSWPTGPGAGLIINVIKQFPTGVLHELFDPCGFRRCSCPSWSGWFWFRVGVSGRLSGHLLSDDLASPGQACQRAQESARHLAEG